VFVFHVVTDTAGRPEVRKNEKRRKSETNSGTGKSVKQTAQRSQQDNGATVGTDRNGLENLQREIWCKKEWKDVSNQKSRQVERSPGQVFNFGGSKLLIWTILVLPLPCTLEPRIGQSPQEI
jgi:hypothetical protein